jgi:glycosyltransferase involved in cell wall biosynthesis
MAEALAQRGHEVHVVTYHHGVSCGEVPFRIHRIPAVSGYLTTSPGPTPAKLAILDPLLAVKLARVLRTGRIDIVHAHHYEGLLAALLAARRTRHPIVFDAHTLLASELPYYRLGLPRRLAGWIGGRLDAWLPGRARHVVAVTESIRTTLIRTGAVPPERITVISNGVEPDHFDQAQPDRGRGPAVLLYTGTLAPYQGIDLLLHAFEEVHRTRKDVKLCLASGDAFTAYEPLARALGIRRHIEIVPTDFAGLPRLLAAADVAVNPRTECHGLPQKLLNYMRAGKPIVTFPSAASFLAEGRRALVVKEESAPALARAVLTLLEDRALAARLGANARAFARARLSWESVAVRTEAVYEQVIRPRPARASDRQDPVITGCAYENSV